jgi:biotin synthase
MLTPDQAQSLAEAGLDYYNHNIDTSEEHYKEIITTRTFQDRLDTLANVRQAGMKVCCGGIVGMGESGDDRAAMLTTLATLEVHPESVPVNLLIRVPGTPMEGLADTDPLDFVRTVAVARILMPKSHVRIAAGRKSMSDELQAMCFFAGCNSIFCGDVLLTAGNAAPRRDQSLFDRLGLTPETL